MQTVSKIMLVGCIFAVLSETILFGASESGYPTSRYVLDIGTGHEGRIYVDYPWFSSYRTFILRKEGGMPLIKAVESSPGQGVFNPNDTSMVAGVGLQNSLTFTASVSESLTTEMRGELGIPEVASVGGTVSGTVQIQLGVAATLTFSLSSSVTLEPGQSVYPIVYLKYKDIYYATTQYNEGMTGHIYCFDCGAYNGSTCTVTDIYSHVESHAVFYDGNGCGIAPKICAGSTAEPLAIPDEPLSDGETLNYIPGRNWANYGW